MRRARHTTNDTRVRPAAAAAMLLLLVASVVCFAVPAFAQEHATPPQATPTAERPATAPGESPAASEHQPQATGEHAAAEGEGAHEGGGSLLGTVGRLFNFLVLAGVLVYYLRAPIMGYLARRSTEIRRDLTNAAETREAASAELSAIEQKMKALPSEIEALKARGAREVAAEEARIRQAADAERERVLAQARRDIDLQVKAAERELVKQAADLSIGLAAERIKGTITDADQARLVDRYLADVKK